MKNKVNKFLLVAKSKLPKLEFKTNQTFRDHTTFHIGGKICIFVEVNDECYLLVLLKLIKQYKIQYFILGNGSNLLCTDKVFYGIVIKISLKMWKVRGEKLICGSGINLFHLNLLAEKMQLSGLEWSFGIPGSVGGAVFMNAGCYAKEMKDVVSRVYYTDGSKIYVKSNKECNFAYRQSFFSNKDFVILRVEFNLKKGNKSEIEKACKYNFKDRISKQPYNEFSAGSVFQKNTQLAVPIMLEQCKMKGKSIGYAQISNKHCGFIVNRKGKAKFNQVFKLINKIKRTVSKKFDIILKEEIIIVKNKERKNVFCTRSKNGSVR